MKDKPDCCTVEIYTYFYITRLKKKQKNKHNKGRSGLQKSLRMQLFTYYISNIQILETQLTKCPLNWVKIIIVLVFVAKVKTKISSNLFRFSLLHSTISSTLMWMAINHIFGIVLKNL